MSTPQEPLCLSQASVTCAQESVPDELIICLNSARDISKDDDNPTYAIHIGDWRCEVKKCSMLYYVAVRSKNNHTFPPHCGLMVKNTFYVKGSRGDSTEYKYQHLLVHALLKKNEKTSDSTYIVLVFCNERERVFQKLRGVHKAYEDATESQSDGIMSSTSCSDLVTLVTAELQKPFDPDWASHLTGAEKAGGNVTNCALLTARIFHELSPANIKEDAVQNLQAAFANLGLKDLATKYLSDFND